MKILHAVTAFLLFAVALPLSPQSAAAATVPIITYNVSVSPVATGGGRILYSREDISSGKDIAVASGKSVTLKFVPDAHYRVKDVVLVDALGEVHRGPVKSTKIKVLRDTTVSAAFEKIPYRITAAIAKGGTIDVPPETTGTYGEQKTFTVTPDKANGYYLVDLKLDRKSIKSLVQDNDSFTIPVTGTHKLSATFSNIYTIKASAAIGGSISPKGTVKLRYGASKEFTITPKKGYYRADVIVDGENRGPKNSILFTVNKWEAAPVVHTVEATFANTPQYPVTASAGAGGTITPSGIVSLAPGEEQVFTISPGSGNRIADVVVDGVSQGPVSQYVMTGTDKTRSIAASFDVAAHTVTATAGTGGTITPSGAVSVPHGESETFSISAAAGYRILDVQVGGASVGAVETCTLENVNGAKAITATFLPVYAITTSSGTGGSISPSGTVLVDAGQTKTFTVTADAGYALTDVLVDGVSQGTSSSVVVGPINDNSHAVTAVFTRQYILTASAGSGGSIVPSGAVPVLHGQSQAFRISPAAGYRILDVKVGGVSVGTLETYPFDKVTQDTTIAATFARIYTVSATAGAGGTIAPSGAVSVDAGHSQTFTVKADPGYAVKEVVVDGVPQGTPATVTVGPVNEHGHVVTATFTKTYDIAASAGTGGTIVPSGTVPVAEGGSQYFSIKADDGYRIGSVRVDDAPIAATDSYKYENVREAGHKIEATFVKTYTITASVAAGGSIGPGTLTADGGSSVSFTITAEAGYQLSKVEIDGVALPDPVAVHTFTNLDADHTIMAFFTPLHTVTTMVEGAGGKIVPPGPIVVAHGGAQSFLIVPDTGHAISKVEIDGVDTGAVVSGHTFTSITTDRTLRAWFAPLSYPIGATAGSGGSISPSGTVGAVFGSSKTFTIAAVTGYHIYNVVVDGEPIGAVESHTFESIDKPHTIYAEFAADDPVTFAVSAQVAVLGGGTISPAGVTTVADGDSITYMIVPDLDHHVADVEVDGISLGAIDRYTFTGISSNRRIVATFEPNAWDMKTIVARASGCGTISPSGAVTFPSGTSQAFIAIPAAGCHVASITVDEVSFDTAAPANLTAGLDREIVATFAPDAPPEYPVTAEITGEGTVAPALPTMAVAGSTLTLQFLPAEGHRVKSVTINGVAKGAITAYTLASIMAEQTIQVTFESAPPATFAIAAGAGPGGVISPWGTRIVDEGATPVYTVIPDPGYHVASVDVDGLAVALQPDGTYTFPPVYADSILTAKFAADVVRTHTITASATDGGTITPAGGVTVARGAGQTFTITPNAGFRVADVAVDGVSVGSLSAYTLIGVDRDYTIAARFEQIPPTVHTIATSASTGGTVSPSGTVTVGAGTDQKIAFIANQGYVLTEVVIDGVARPEAIFTATYGEFQFTAIAGSHTAYASFTPAVPVKHAMTASVESGSGTITPSGVTEVLEGYSQAFQITPADGYTLIDVVVESVVDGAPTSVSLGPVSDLGFISVNKAYAIKAFFAKLHNVRVDRNAGGSVSPDGDTQVTDGSSLTFTISPEPGYVVESAEITRNGVTENIGAVGSYTLTDIREDVHLAVVFKQQFKITATAGAGGTISPAGEQKVLLGGTATYTIAPAAGYTVVGVEIDGAPRGALTSYTFTSAETYKDHTIHATFVRLFSITAAVDGEGGTISPAGTNIIVENRSATYSFTPAAGYTVREVIVDGESKGAPTKYTFSAVNGDHTVTVRFGRIFSVTATATAGGTISPVGKLILPQGASQAYTVTAHPGYVVQNVQVQRGEVTEQLGAVSAVNVSDISSDVTIYATFIAVFDLTATRIGNGTISPAGKTTVVQGSTVTYTITPDPGNYLVEVVVDGVSKGAPTTYEFAAINNSHNIVARFASIHKITVTRTGGGTVTPKPEETVLSWDISVLDGATQKFVFTPEDKVVVKDVIVDGISVGNVSDYTFLDVRADHTISVVFGQPQSKKAVVRIVTAGNIGETKIASLMVTLTVPAGVSAAVATDLFANGVATLTSLTTGSFTQSEYIQAVPGGPGTITLIIASPLFGFGVGDMAVLNLDVAEGAFPKVGDFSLQLNEVLDDSYPNAQQIAGVSALAQTTFTY